MQNLEETESFREREKTIKPGRWGTPQREKPARGWTNGEVWPVELLWPSNALLPERGVGLLQPPSSPAPSRPLPPPRFARPPCLSQASAANGACGFHPVSQADSALWGRRCALELAQGRAGGCLVGSRIPGAEEEHAWKYLCNSDRFLHWCS